MYYENICGMCRLLQSYLDEGSVACKNRKVVGFSVVIWLKVNGRYNQQALQCCELARKKG